MVYTFTPKTQEGVREMIENLDISSIPESDCVNLYIIDNKSLGYEEYL